MVTTRIRLLHFIDALGAGGAERQLIYLLENLDRERFEPHVVTTYDTFRHYETTIRQLGIPVYSLHHGELRLMNRASALTNYVRLMWSLRPQIVHSWLHYPNLIARGGRPFCPPHRLVTAIRSHYSPRQLRSERATAWLSDFRIVNYENLWGDHRQKSILIPNGIPTDFFSRNKPNNRKQPSTDTDSQFTVLMVARIDPRKDHHTLIETLKILKPELPTGFKVILIGEITNLETQHKIQLDIRKYQLESIIEQLPPTHKTDTYYQATDICLLTSISEGFPNTILESFAAGKPIIISEAANPGIVQHGINGWIFLTGDTYALAECLKTAWKTTYKERITMGENGRAIAAQYTVVKMVARYTQLYEDALKRS